VGGGLGFELASPSLNTTRILLSANEELKQSFRPEFSIAFDEIYCLPSVGEERGKTNRQYYVSL